MSQTIVLLCPLHPDNKVESAVHHRPSVASVARCALLDQGFIVVSLEDSTSRHTDVKCCCCVGEGFASNQNDVSLAPLECIEIRSRQSLMQVASGDCMVEIWF